MRAILTAKAVRAFFSGGQRSGQSFSPAAKDCNEAFRSACDNALSGPAPSGARKFTPPSSGSIAGHRCGLAYSGSIALLLLLSIGTFQAVAATFYVRQGAAGNGSNWTDAYGSLPSVLQRGATYYVADGSYGNYTFDDAESGTTPIIVKKATATDHGTHTGWQTAFGDGEAVFSGQLKFQDGYYVLDGNSTGIGQYGFLLNTNSSPAITLHDGSVGSNFIAIKSLHIDMTGSPSGKRGIEGNYGPDNLHLYNVKITDCTEDAIYLLDDVDNALIEYSHINTMGPNNDPTRHHADAIAIKGLGTGNIFRYNFFDWNGQIIWLDGQASTHGSLELYGNVFYSSQGGGAKWISHHSNVTTIHGLTILNNTIANAPVGGRINSGVVLSGEIRNNIFVKSWFTFADIPHSHNAADVSTGEPTGQIVTTSIFNDYASFDLGLKIPTQPGQTLPIPYNQDRDGNIRGADGTWDRGAYEFGPSSPIPSAPEAPQNLSATVN